MNKKNDLKISVFIILFLAVVLAGKVSSQQMSIYSQYMFNKFLINPAVAGSEGYTSFNLTAREQWLGFKDAPYTHALCAQTRLSPKSWLNRIHQIRTRYSKPSRVSNVGFGGYVFNDHRGLIDQTGIQLTYAYHLNLDEKQLSFGLSASLTQFSINKKNMILDEVDDELVTQYKLNMFIPDFNFGAYFITPEYYAGISVAQLVQSALKFADSPSDTLKQRRHYFVMGGYRFSLNRDYSVEPSFLFKFTEKFENQLDIGARFYYLNNYWGGIAFRTGAAIILTGGVRYDKFYFGYAVDITINKLQNHSYGSHEFMISYKFGQSVRSSTKWLERY